MPATTTPTADLTTRDADSLEAELATLAAHIHAATSRLLELIAEIDRREIWAEQGARSMAHWLQWRTGIDLGAARQKVRVARALGQLPRLAAELRAGRLSYSVVRAITRVATPENEAALLHIARNGTTSHVERLVRAYRRGERHEQIAAANRQHDARYLRTYHDESGMLVLEARLPPEAGALVEKALQQARQALFEEGRARGRAARAGDVSAEPPSPSSPPAPVVSELQGSPQLRADALVRMAEVALAAASAGGPDAGAAEPPTVVVHVDAEALKVDRGAGRSDIEDGGAVSAETSRRLACDAGVVTMSWKSGAPLDVGRRTRSISAALRRALRARDGGCRFPGCTATRFVDGHHLVHWADGGSTSPANVLLLCRSCHRRVHEGGWRIEGDATSARFIRPDGKHQPARPPLPAAADWDAMFDDHRRMGLLIDDTTCASGWQGDRMDYDLALQCLGSHGSGRSPLHQG